MKTNVKIVVTIVVIIIAALMSGCSNLETIPWNDSEIQQMKDTQWAEQEISPEERPEISSIVKFSF